jgi:hypothetical protein
MASSGRAKPGPLWVDGGRAWRLKGHLPMVVAELGENVDLPSTFAGSQL